MDKPDSDFKEKILPPVSISQNTPPVNPNSRPPQGMPPGGQQYYQAPPPQYNQNNQYGRPPQGMPPGGQQYYQAPPPPYYQNQYNGPPQGMQMYGQQYNQPPQTGNKYNRPPKIKSPFLALILSFLIPGLGQLYNGRILKGILIFLFACVFAGLSIFLIGVPFLLILWFYNLYDAYSTADQMRFEAMQAFGTQRYY